MLGYMPFTHVQLSFLKVGQQLGRKRIFLAPPNNIRYVRADLFFSFFAHRDISNVHVKESPYKLKWDLELSFRLKIKEIQIQTGAM